MIFIYLRFKIIKKIYFCCWAYYFSQILDKTGLLLGLFFVFKKIKTLLRES